MSSKQAKVVAEQISDSVFYVRLDGAKVGSIVKSANGWNGNVVFRGRSIVVRGCGTAHEAHIRITREVAEALEGVAA